MFYSYLNLENTKTMVVRRRWTNGFYSYLNLENTKTLNREEGLTPKSENLIKTP